MESKFWVNGLLAMLYFMGVHPVAIGLVHLAVFAVEASNKVA